MQRNDLKISGRYISARHDLDQSGYQYQLASAVRENSIITQKHNGEVETFTSAGELGRGANGVVRLFRSKQDAGHVVAVKSALIAKDLMVDFDQDELNGNLRATNREIEYLAKLYPAYSPYLIKHFINENGLYDHRILMPVFPGKTLSHFVKTEIHSAQAYALLMLKISQEVARLHEMGLYHGDLRSGNIIIQQSDKIEFGMPSYAVHLIDFDYGGEIGKDRFADVEGDIALFEMFYMGINHQTDIMYLQLWFNICKANLFFRYPEAKTILQEHFPALSQFSAEGDAVDMAVPDPEKLKLFINNLTANMAAWQQGYQLHHDRKQGYAANLGLFPMRKTKTFDDEEIATQWHASRTILR